MPISKDEFDSLDETDTTPDLAPDTTQGVLYRFLLTNGDKAFRQREIRQAVDVPDGSVGPTLSRLEQYGLLEHRGQYWTIADSERAIESAAQMGAETADGRDGGFTEKQREQWMENAVEPVAETDES